MTRLYPIGGGPAVAWSDDDHTYLKADGALFAWREGDMLLAEVGGEAIGWFSGGDVFGIDGKPLYFSG